MYSVWKINVCSLESGWARACKVRWGRRRSTASGFFSQVDSNGRFPLCHWYPGLSFSSALGVPCVDRTASFEEKETVWCPSHLNVSYNLGVRHSPPVLRDAFRSLAFSRCPLIRSVVTSEDR